MRLFPRWNIGPPLHPVFWAVPSFVLGVLVAMLAGADDKVAPAAIGLLGVLIGGLVAGAAAKSSQQTQLTAAIWPQRLKAHQDAFALWNKCSAVVHSEENDQNPVLQEAQIWWKENCLYLSAEASEQFVKMLDRVRMHRGLVEDGRGQRDPVKTEAVKENFRLIRETGRVIAKGAGGHLSDRVLKELAPEQADGA